MGGDGAAGGGPGGGPGGGWSRWAGMERRWTTTDKSNSGWNLDYLKRLKTDWDELVEKERARRRKEEQEEAVQEVQEDEELSVEQPRVRGRRHAGSADEGEEERAQSKSSTFERTREILEEKLSRGTSVVQEQWRRHHLVEAETHDKRKREGEAYTSKFKRHWGGQQQKKAPSPSQQPGAALDYDEIKIAPALENQEEGRGKVVQEELFAPRTNENFPRAVRKGRRPGKVSPGLQEMVARFEPPGEAPARRPISRATESSRRSGQPLVTVPIRTYEEVSRSSATKGDGDHQVGDGEELSPRSQGSKEAAPEEVTAALSSPYAKAIPTEMQEVGKIATASFPAPPPSSLPPPPPPPPSPLRKHLLLPLSSEVTQSNPDLASPSPSLVAAAAAVRPNPPFWRKLEESPLSQPELRSDRVRDKEGDEKRKWMGREKVAVESLPEEEDEEDRTVQSAFAPDLENSILI